MAWDNLSGAIFEHATRQPDAPALIEGPMVLSYRDFAALGGKASVYLRDHGIAAGSGIGLALGNSIDQFILYFALIANAAETCTKRAP